MWKDLKNGDAVAIGDTLRYRANSNSLLPQEDIYQVLMIEQHYFEIILEPADANRAEPALRKVVRYVDIGYNVLLQRWSKSQETQ